MRRGSFTRVGLSWEQLAQVAHGLHKLARRGHERSEERRERAGSVDRVWRRNQIVRVIRGIVLRIVVVVTCRVVLRVRGADMECVQLI